MSAPSNIQRPKARRFRRLTVRVEVEIRSAERTCLETATTLGAGGLFVEMDDPLPRSTLLSLRFELPGSERTFEIRGRVVWSTPAGDSNSSASPGMGIEFTDRVAISALARELEEPTAQPQQSRA